jgi:multimeric flavodoxin WrbA
MKVVAIGGSPRLNGNTNYLIDEVLQVLSANEVKTEKIVISEYKVSPCQGHQNCSTFKECKLQDDAAWILEKFAQADGVILASPVYYYGMSAQMKSFMDRNYFYFTHDKDIQARCAGLIAIGGSEGAGETIGELKKMFKFIDIRIFTLEGYADRVGDARKNAKLVKQAQYLGQQMADCLKSGAKA